MDALTVVVADDFIKIINAFDFSGLIFLSFKLFIILIFMNLMRTVVIDISLYLAFKSNPYVSIGADVIVNGFEGEINRITFGYIYIQDREEQRKHKTIRTSKWQECDWIFINR